MSLGTISSVIFLHEAHWYLPVHLTHGLLFDFAIPLALSTSTSARWRCRRAHCRATTRLARCGVAVPVSTTRLSTDKTGKNVKHIHYSSVGSVSKQEFLKLFCMFIAAVITNRRRGSMWKRSWAVYLVNTCPPLGLLFCEGVRRMTELGPKLWQKIFWNNRSFPTTVERIINANRNNYFKSVF